MSPPAPSGGEGSKDSGHGGGGQGGGAGKPPPKGAPEKDYSYEYDEEDEEEEETSDDDPVELPNLTSLPACCSCPRQGTAVFHKTPRPAENGVITRPDSAGNLLGVCLNPQGWGTLRANQGGAMRRLCGHIVCIRCVVATAKGNTCRCCAARAKTPSGAGQLPVSPPVHVRDRVPAEAVGPVGASKAGGAPHLASPPMAVPKTPPKAPPATAGKLPPADDTLVEEPKPAPEPRLAPTPKSPGPPKAPDLPSRPKEKWLVKKEKSRDRKKSGKDRRTRSRDRRRSRRGRSRSRRRRQRTSPGRSPHTAAPRRHLRGGRGRARTFPAAPDPACRVPSAAATFASRQGAEGTPSPATAGGGRGRVPRTHLPPPGSGGGGGDDDGKGEGPKKKKNRPSQKQRKRLAAQREAANKGAEGETEPPADVKQEDPDYDGEDLENLSAPGGREGLGSLRERHA